MPAPAPRAEWLAWLDRVARPVLQAAAETRLRRDMPVEAHVPAARGRFTHLEAVGRTLVGVAPWLELEGVADTEETTAQARFRAWAVLALDALTDPASPDHANWCDGTQPLVDAAFVAQAILRAPRTLHHALPEPVRGRLTDSLRATRRIVPGLNNWLLFSAAVEAAIFRLTGSCDHAPIRFAIHQHEAWYKGDGAYGDGRRFHWDYYNSFVIQPMLLDVLETLGDAVPEAGGMLSAVRERARRYAAVQERLIAPDGTFPPIGRSLCYRGGAFHLLAQMALRLDLPEGVDPAQVREALSAVLRRTLDAPGTFDNAGWLTLGLAGRQPSLAEGYISTGSLYLCSAAFLPLGLPASAPFWSDPPRPWTSRRIWAGDDAPADHALHD